jgi:uncharacterized protein YjiS (DUF1127 family)
MNLTEQAGRLSADPRQNVRADSIWPSWLQARLDHIAAVWADRRKRAREVRDLYRFTDRELWDVGLSRSDLRAIANGTYRRE